MVRVASLIFVAALFFCLTPGLSIASEVVINEFLPNSEAAGENAEWIEIYNTSSSPVDISGWWIDDADGGSPMYAIAQNTIINGNSFLVFDKSATDIALNNDTDSVRLLNANSEIQDSYIYSKTIDDHSYGRKSDGASEWVEFFAVTKSTANSSGTIVPTSTIVPTNSPTPTKTPTVTLTQAPSATPTLVPTRVVSQKPSPTVSKKVSVTQTPTKFPLHTDSQDNLDKLLQKNSPTPLFQETQVLGESTDNLGTLFVSIGGALLLGCGILVFYMKSKQQ